MISHTCMQMQRLPVVLKIVIVCNMAPTTTTTTPHNRHRRSSSCSSVLLLLLLLLEGVCLSHGQQQPQQQETNETLCESFSRHSSSSSDAASEFIDSSSSSSSHVFTSPLYPKEYPPNLQCIRVIEAPPGHVIRLSFLESFSIEWESSSCRYDNLEIRDGQFGYSSMIEKLCGDVPPSFIESSGRFLWLRFNSDKDIQYGGFKVQVNFISSSSSSSSSGSFSSGSTNALLDTTCSMYLVNLTEGYLRSEDIPGEVLSQRWSLGGVPIDCTWVIEAKEDEKIYLQFFQYALAHPNDCTANFVEVYGGKTELEGEEGRISHFCGSEADSVTSKRNVMHVRFLSGIKVSSSGGGSGADPAGVMKQVVVPDSTLEAYFSVFRDLKEGQSCVKNREFDCTDNTCIDFSLRCNEGKANCKLRNDEEGCDLAKGRFKLTTDILIISFLGILLMAGMCSGLLLNIYRKLREDKLWGHHHDNSHQSSSSSPAGGSSSNKDPEQQAGGGNLEEDHHPAAAAGGGKQRSIQEVLRQPAAHQQHQQQKEGEGGSSSSGGGCSSSDGTGTTTVSPPLKKLSSELVRRVEVRDTGCQATPPPPPPPPPGGLPAQDAHHHQPGRMSCKTPSLPAGAVVPPSSGGGVVVVVPSSRRKTHADILVID